VPRVSDLDAPGEPDTADPTVPAEPTAPAAPSDPTGYPAPQSGEGDNTAIQEVNLLEVLNVDTVAEAIKELHTRIQSGQMGGLKLGMYLDMDSIKPTGESTITGDPTTQNLRIVIASFNQYKGQMGNDSTTNHIKFVFKNIPVNKEMRSGTSVFEQDEYGNRHGNGFNEDGYPYDEKTAITYAGYGKAELRPYLEDKFLPGLKTALGIADDSYFYAVTRDLVIGRKDNWDKTDFTAKIFIDTSSEVSGPGIYHVDLEARHIQTALYAVGGDTWKKKKLNGTESLWWRASPYAPNTYGFYGADSGSLNSKDPYGVVPAFCIK
jgi:hypothetical protein